MAIALLAKYRWEANLKPVLCRHAPLQIVTKLWQLGSGPGQLPNGIAEISSRPHTALISMGALKIQTLEIAINQTAVA